MTVRPEPIRAFAYDEGNLWEMGRHGVSALECDQALENGLAIRRNRRDRAAEWIAFGRTDGGDCLAIPVDPTDQPGIWRPATAWRCKPHEWRPLARRER